MKLMKKYTVFIVIGLLIIASVIIGFKLINRDRDFPQINSSGVLRVVTDYNPVDYYVSGDSLAGFNYELIQLLQKQTPIKIEVVLENSLDKTLQGLNDKDYDVIIRSIPITTDLRNSLSFTNPVTQSKQVLIQRKAEYNGDIEPIRSHLDLANKEIYVPKQSPAILRINNLSSEIGDSIFVKEDELYGIEQLAMMVASKEIDYAACDELIANRLAEQIPELDVNTLIGFTQFEAWGVRKESPILLDSLNTWINRIKKTEDFVRICDKYYK